jgi:hypothetical protein
MEFDLVAAKAKRRVSSGELGAWRDLPSHTGSLLRRACLRSSDATSLLSRARFRRVRPSARDRAPM